MQVDLILGDTFQCAGIKKSKHAGIVIEMPDQSD